MEIKGEYKIAAPREKVFAALNDTSVLKECIPGCESLEKLSDNEMTAKVRLRIGPVSAAFSGKVTLSDIDPPNGYKITGEGQGGVAGFAKGGAVVTLREDGPDTILEYSVDAQVGGKIAQVGARLITGTARKLADEFFGKFATSINNPSPAAIAGVPTSRLPPPVMAPSAAVQRGYRHWTVIGVSAAVLILIFLASR
jgi:uncharacterized protein